MKITLNITTVRPLTAEEENRVRQCILDGIADVGLDDEFCEEVIEGATCEEGATHCAPGGAIGIRS